MLSNEQRLNHSRRNKKLRFSLALKGNVVSLPHMIQELLLPLHSDLP